MKNKIFVLACFYDEKREATLLGFLSFLNGLFSNKFEMYFIVVNNNKGYIFNKNSLNNELNIKVIQGDNLDAEFGAWQVGIDYVIKDLNPQITSKFIILNDTLFHNFFPNFIGLLEFANQVVNNTNNPLISGQIIPLSHGAEVMKLSLERFVCSAIFLLNYKALAQLDFSVLNLTKEQVKQESPNNSYELLINYFDKDVLSYKIGHWLFGGHWYKSKKYNEFDRELLCLKIAMIVNEFFLSAKLINKKTEFIDSLKVKFSIPSSFQTLKIFISNFSFLDFLKVFLIYSQHLKRKWKLRVKNTA